MHGQKKRGFILLLMGSLLSGCVAMPPHQQQGAAIGGTVGGIAGVALDRRNPWRGGVIGAAIGALTGATIAEVSAQGTRQVATAGQPVEYRMEGNGGYYYAEPVGYRDNCRQIRERIYQNGYLVQTRIVEVCNDDHFIPPGHRKKHKKHWKDDEEYDD
jgi:gas vesicle protein